MSEYADKFMYDFIYKGKYNYGIVVDFYSDVLEDGKRFSDVIDSFSKDLGYNWKVMGCSFASSCDEEDIENGDYFEDGVMFYLNDDDVIIDYQTFYNCLKLACEIYLKKYPEEKNMVHEKLSIVRNRYNITDRSKIL